jgi:hypothetical protein
MAAAVEAARIDLLATLVREHDNCLHAGVACNEAKLRGFPGLPDKKGKLDFLETVAFASGGRLVLRRHAAEEKVTDYFEFGPNALATDARPAVSAVRRPLAEVALEDPGGVEMLWLVTALAVTACCARWVLGTKVTVDSEGPGPHTVQAAGRVAGGGVLVIGVVLGSDGGALAALQAGVARRRVYGFGVTDVDRRAFGAPIDLQLPSTRGLGEIYSDEVALVEKSKAFGRCWGDFGKLNGEEGFPDAALEGLCQALPHLALGKYALADAVAMLQLAEARQLP